MVGYDKRVDIPEVVDSPEEDPIDTSPVEIQENDDGTIEFEFGEDELDEDTQFNMALASADHYANLATMIDEDTLNEIGHELCDLVNKDDESRSEWVRILKDGVEELGLKIDDTNVPFEGACVATHPLLMEAVTKFQAKSYSELFPSKGPVETKILGFETEPTREQAIRVKKFMNYEVQHLMPEYGPELDRGLFSIGLTGSGFKKNYFDPVLGRPCSRFVRSNDFIIDYWASDLETCERYTHRFLLTSNELLKSQIVEFYREVDLGSPSKPQEDEAQEEIKEIEGRTSVDGEDKIYTIYEIHTIYDLPGFEDIDEDGDVTGLALPYIVTVDVESCKILSIRRNWVEGDKNKRKKMHFVHYPMIPGLGFYGYGYLHLIGSLAKTATSATRQLIDAGTFATLPAGFKAHGLRVSGDKEPFQPGEFKEVQAPMGDLQKSIVPLPFKEPSATLYNLLDFVVKGAEKFVDSTEQLLSEAKNYGPVGTTMALLEQGGKLYSAIHKRLHTAQAQDFKILAQINYEWLPEVYPFKVHKGAEKVLKQDFDGRVDVIPVSDPNMPTQAHRISRAQAIFAIAAQSPQMHNMRNVLRAQYEALGEEDPEKYLSPPPTEAAPLDPITENTNIMTMKPVKAGINQNHMAHVKAHTAFMEMPTVQKNPVALNAGMAHIFEHVSMEYRLRIQHILGFQLPPPNQPIPPEVEEAIALASVEATEALLQEDIMKEVLKDPTAMVAMQGLELEAQKIALKDQADQDRLDLDWEKMLRDDMNKDLDRWVDSTKLAKDAKYEQNKLKYERENARAKLNSKSSE